MLKPISLASISLHHILSSYWPYLHQHYSQTSQKPSSLLINININFSSQTLINKINIIYQNSMIGLIIGLSFFHLMPLANSQIAYVLYKVNHTHEETFAYGTMTAVLAFVFVLGNSNYFYQKNSTKNTPKRQNFRNRSQFEYEMLSNKKLKIKRRLAIQPLTTQFMVSLPSVLLTSSLAANNSTQIWFWCLVTILFEKQHVCSYFGKSYLAAGLSKGQAIRMISFHLIASFMYLIGCMLVVEIYPLMSGVMNGISCGIIMYDVMIEKLAQNYQEKQQLFQKLLFFVCGVMLSTLIV